MCLQRSCDRNLPPRLGWRHDLLHFDVPVDHDWRYQRLPAATDVKAQPQDSTNRLLDLSSRLFLVPRPSWAPFPIDSSAQHVGYG
jgi:hypothetical protein